MRKTHKCFDITLIIISFGAKFTAMKRLLLLLLLPQMMFAQSYRDQEEFAEYIRDYDPKYYCHITDSLKETLDTLDDPCVYWESLLFTNKDRWKFFQNPTIAPESYKRAEMILDIYQRCADSEYIFSERRGYVRLNEANEQFLISKMSGSSQLSWVRPKKIFISYEDDYNAFVMPTGIFCITKPLFDELEFDELLAIMGHEMAHYVLNHSVVQEHKLKNRKKRNKIITALIGAAVAFGEAGLRMRGAEVEDDFSEFYGSLYSGAQRKAVLYGYETSREQELEADIVSFRYLQAIGMDPDAMARALIKLRDICGDTYAMQTSTHPTLSYRINLLQYLWYIDRKDISLKPLLEE